MSQDNIDTKALEMAVEAKSIAEHVLVAHQTLRADIKDIHKSVDVGFTSLRAENTEQHRANAAIMRDFQREIRTIVDQNRQETNEVMESFRNILVTRQMQIAVGIIGVLLAMLSYLIVEGQPWAG